MNTKMPKINNQIIAELAIRYARDAAGYFPNVDEGDLRIQIGFALLKAAEMQDVSNRLFNDPLVDKLFPDGGLDPDSLVWDLV